MSDSQLNPTTQTTTMTRARRGAAAVIAQYIQELSEAHTALARTAAGSPPPLAH